MSEECRELLVSIWQNAANNSHLRETAFKFWSATQAPEDSEVLRCIESSDALTDSILQQRLIRGDLQAIPALLEKITNDEKSLWWQYGRYIWTSELSEALDKTLEKRSNLAQQLWFESIEPDWIIHDLISRMEVNDAEQILLKHWDHLRFSEKYVSTALYFSTPKLLELADASIKECPEPGKMLQRLSFCFGVKISGHPGVKSETQLRSLAPYVHLLSSVSIHDFWEECNERGWFEVRRELFDSFLKPSHTHFKWDPNQARFSLDEMIAEDRLIWLDTWIDGILKTDVSWSEILSTILAWFEDKKSLKAFKLLTSAIEYQGSRKDLSALKGYEDMPELDITQLIANTEFTVKRRSIF
ncbi:hypothetical protein N836_25160 [Leptolyngbya sp. Heron Island J]|uniref:hypothetical protein n=1 Tax=Leptolyngbya sp. Heron Island J TaxID=1385935 RepID=UPI0003B9416B|nr:hypothetical protein [Leptolyngbya sp. Heron Island J]ESA32607.1 hypothetical protein N836_25160 [Leptolyngbya sp. Heron Island J]